MQPQPEYPTMNDVSNFAASLVEMARAMERLPNAEAELRNVKGELDAAYASIQRLELRAIGRANELNALQSQLREMEAQRDDAELRFLELEDTLRAVRRALGVV